MTQEAPEAIREIQLERLRELLPELAASNPFYGERISASGMDPASVGLEEFSERMPFTTREDWVGDQLAHPPYGTNLTFPMHRYSRFCRTSGSTGKPMHWLDTPESWSAMLDAWDMVFGAAGVVSPHRIFFAFSFGPFLGFWTAYEAATRAGHLSIPGGGLSTVARLEVMRDTRAEVLCCTPTYAIRLARVAAEQGIDLSESLRVIIVAGEPGGSLPVVRDVISRSWNDARVCDHHGMTEVGPVTYESPENPCTLVVMENAFYAEIIDDELVLTTLRRNGSPLLRYRTGDRVRARRDPDSGELHLEGGILGRTDDMVVVRGVNIFPAAVEEVVRSVDAVEEFQVEVTRPDAMYELNMNVELKPDASNAVMDELSDKLKAAFSLRIPVNQVAAGSLPRFEMKSQRWIRHDRNPAA